MIHKNQLLTYGGFWIPDETDLWDKIQKVIFYFFIFWLIVKRNVEEQLGMLNIDDSVKKITKMYFFLRGNTFSLHGFYTTSRYNFFLLNKKYVFSLFE